MIKAIETHYNGYRFRSRLEARWAVFFDALGIKYQYELEGFDLGDLGWYLPDFYLPSIKTWLEIKPIVPTLDEVAKILKIATDTDSCGYVLCGDPGLPELKVLENGQWELQRGAAAFGRGRIVSWGNMPKTDWHDRSLQTWRISTCLEFWPLYTHKIPPPAEFPLQSLDGKSSISSNCLPEGTWYLCPEYSGGWMHRHYSGDGVEYDHPDLIAAYKTARGARFEHGETPRV